MGGGREGGGGCRRWVAAVPRTPLPNHLNTITNNKELFAVRAECILRFRRAEWVYSSCGNAMSAADEGRDLFGRDSDSDSSGASVASLGTDGNTAGDPLANAAVNDDDDGTDPGSAVAVGGAASEAGDGADPCAGESGAGGGAGGGGGVLDQVAEIDVAA